MEFTFYFYILIISADPIRVLTTDHEIHQLVIVLY